MLLDEVIDVTHTNGLGVSKRSSDTDFAVSKFGHALPFRGLLHDVRGLANGERLAKSQLAWKVHQMPVGVIGQTETRKVDGYQALVRGDTSACLSIVSDSFQVHQTSEILQDMDAMAEAGQAEMCFLGGLDGGRKVVAIAKLEGEFTLPDKRQAAHWNSHAGGAVEDDKTYLFVIISGGHVVGSPCKIRGYAFRRWCANGAFFTVVSTSEYTQTHRGKIRNDRERIRACYESIRMEFSAYGQDAARLQAMEVEKDQQRLYVAELLKPGIAAEIGAKLEIEDNAKVWLEVSDSLRGRTALNDAIRKHSETAGFSRTANNLLEAIVEQDGANGRNLWTAYNGVTWFVDHKRGRNPETGTDAALFGAGAVLKEKALETALKFVQ